MSSQGPEKVDGGAEDSAAAPSTSLIPLQPAQKRKLDDLDLGLKRTSTVFKSQRSTELLKPVARHAFNPWLSERMRVRHSGPGQEREQLSGELRGSKSAPDLRGPILAAIRGLQDGSIQVDGRTRAKIAHAAKRVLETRELKRRTSHEGFRPPGAAVGQVRQSQISEARATEPRQLQDTDMTVSSANTAQQGPALQLSPKNNGLRNSNRASPNLDYPRAEFRRPSADEAEVPEDSRTAEARMGRPSPFTVTTGVPKFLSGVSNEHVGLPNTSSLKHARTRSVPLPISPLNTHTSPNSLPRSLDFGKALNNDEAS